jgi:hypothetical protein
MVFFSFSKDLRERGMVSGGVSENGMRIQG